jgi:hypothetical protein
LRQEPVHMLGDGSPTENGTAGDGIEMRAE